MSKKGDKTAPTPKVEPETTAAAEAKIVPPDESAPKEREPPMVVAESPRARTTTVVAKALEPTTKPPEMPTAPAPIDVSMGGVEDPTQMPPPKNIPAGHPTDPASAPGRVPAGDSRSLRRGNEFALIYRRDTFVISRSGTVGTRGQWRVVEYPTSASASHSYAKECSRFVSDGYSDYRD